MIRRFLAWANEPTDVRDIGCWPLFVLPFTLLVTLVAMWVAA